MSATTKRAADRPERPAAAGSRRPPKAQPTFCPVAVKPRSAADQITAQLRDALIAGRLRAGDRLAPEPELAAGFGVSRATVREAIKVLRTQGVVRTSRGAKGGHFVSRPETNALAQSVSETYGLWFDAGDVSIAEIDEAREVVEHACVRLAAARRTPAALTEMAEILARTADPSTPLSEFLALDIDFHQAIARAAGNRLLELPMTAIHIVRPRTNQFLRHHDRDAVLAQHHLILEAIAAGDPDGADRAFGAHIAHLAREREAALAERRQPAHEIPVAAIPATEPDPPDAGTPVLEAVPDPTRRS
jgi:DNA-binding FadR family transcriptional regulator